MEYPQFPVTANVSCRLNNYYELTRNGNAISNFSGIEEVSPIDDSHSSFSTDHESSVTDTSIFSGEEKENISPNSETAVKPSVNGGSVTKRKRGVHKDKPPYSYIALISMAIADSTEKRLTLNEIYKFITGKFPFYANHSNQKSWRGSIRHNLALNDCFTKLPKQQGMIVHQWSIDPEYEGMFDHGSYLRRRFRFKDGVRKKGKRANIPGPDHQKRNNSESSVSAPAVSPLSQSAEPFLRNMFPPNLLQTSAASRYTSVTGVDPTMWPRIPYQWTSPDQRKVSSPNSDTGSLSPDTSRHSEELQTSPGYVLPKASTEPSPVITPDEIRQPFWMIGRDPSATSPPPMPLNAGYANVYRSNNGLIGHNFSINLASNSALPPTLSSSAWNFKPYGRPQYDQDEYLTNYDATKRYYSEQYL